MAPEERPSVNVIRNVPSTTSSHLFPIFSKPGRRARVGGMKKNPRGSRMKRYFFYSWRRFRPCHALAPHAATETGQGHNYELTSTIRAIFYRFFEGPEGGRAWVLRKMDPHRSADLSTGQRGFIPPRLVWLHTSKPRHIPHPTTTRGHQLPSTIRANLFRFFQGPEGARGRERDQLDYSSSFLFGSLGCTQQSPATSPIPPPLEGINRRRLFEPFFYDFFKARKAGARGRHEKDPARVSRE